MHLFNQQIFEPRPDLPDLRHRFRLLFHGIMTILKSSLRLAIPHLHKGSIEPYLDLGKSLSASLTTIENAMALNNSALI
jgi:hypothetical protein